MGNRARCEVCGGSMAGKRATAVVCSPACRQAKYRDARRTDAKTEPPKRAPRNPSADDTPEPPAELHGRLEETTRRRFEAAGIDDYDEDPLAVHLLGMARILDNPGSVAPGSLTGMGKAFRDAYKDFMRDHETVDLAKDPVAAVQDEAAQLLAGLGAA